MGNPTTLALRVVITLVLVGSLFVQVVMGPLFWADLDGATTGVRVSVTAIVLFGIVCVQVTAVCVWKLLTMVRRGTVFSDAAFGFVDIICAAIVVASLLAFALGVVLAPGEDVAPGVVLLVGGFAVCIAGVALIVRVLRLLLAQAVARDVEAQHLRAELDEVI